MYCVTGGRSEGRQYTGVGVAAGGWWRGMFERLLGVQQRGMCDHKGDGISLRRMVKVSILQLCRTSINSPHPRHCFKPHCQFILPVPSLSVGIGLSLFLITLLSLPLPFISLPFFHSLSSSLILSLSFSIRNLLIKSESPMFSHFLIFHSAMSTHYLSRRTILLRKISSYNF